MTTSHSDELLMFSAREAVAAWVVQTGFGPTVAEILAPGEPSRAELTRERDAALAAVDAVRADYAPRREPPTAEEVRALARLWGDLCSAPVIVWYRRDALRMCAQWKATAGTRIPGVGMTGYLMLGPDGPVAWSQLAAMVAKGGV